MRCTGAATGVHARRAPFQHRGRAAEPCGERTPIGRIAMRGLLERPPAELADALAAAGTRRGWLVGAGDGLRASTPALRGVADHLGGATSAFDGHAAIFLEACPEPRALFGAFVHRVLRGPAQGGLRNARYASLRAFLDDGLRLSRGMSRKSALAGLWWGGGKGIIALRDAEASEDPDARRALYRAYGRFVSSLRGCYVTAIDAGTTPLDLAAVHATTRFATCLPLEIGGSGDPSGMTAAGVVCAIEAALDHAGAGPIAGKRLAMQGGGSVGARTIERLLDRDAGCVIVSDVSEAQCQALRDRFADAPVEVRLAQPGDPAILREPCDVLVPNGLGGILDDKTIPALRARIVCGAANNQLADERRHAAALRARGILWVPDYVANRMGIVHCANEHAGHLDADPALDRHFGREWPGSIYCTTRRLLASADEEGIAPLEAADRIADAACAEPHPIFGDRAERIVASLVAGSWRRGGA
jgi:glutamate dehydrogenase/leucine dehydrogenase